MHRFTKISCLILVVKEKQRVVKFLVAWRFFSKITAKCLVLLRFVRHT